MHINPFFFGDSKEQLFGIQTLPENGKSNGWGVLICYPFGQEYLRSYQAMQRLATELSKAGVPAMRFDYFGTGDSGGEVGYADPRRCLEDLSKAVTEFRDTCSFEKLALIGLRMGANLAAHFKAEDIERLILLDPVISGSEYLCDLEAMHERLVMDLDRYQAVRAESQGSSVRELIGFSRGQETADSLAGFDLNRLNRASSAEVFLLISAESSATENLANRWQDLGERVHFEYVESDGNWESLASIEEPLRYWPIIRRSVELFI